MENSSSEWSDLREACYCPARRLTLPDCVPDVSAGNSAPVALTHWKIGAIKLVNILHRRGYLTGQDFAHFRISMSRWTQEKWLVRDGSGGHRTILAQFQGPAPRQLRPNCCRLPEVAGSCGGEAAGVVCGGCQMTSDSAVTDEVRVAAVDAAAALRLAISDPSRMGE